MSLAVGSLLCEGPAGLGAPGGAQIPVPPGPPGFSRGLRPHSQNVPAHFLGPGTSSFSFSSLFLQRPSIPFFLWNVLGDGLFSDSLSWNFVCRNLVLLACQHSFSLSGSQRDLLPPWSGVQESSRKQNTS